MEIEVNNGLHIVSVGLNYLGSYFRVHGPVSLVWYDNRGSVGQYMCLLPGSEKQKQEMRDSITSRLFEDFTGRTEELYDTLKPLFRLFPNGKYHLGFTNGSKKPEVIVHSGDQTTTYLQSWYVAYADPVNLGTADELVRNYHAHLSQHDIDDGIYDKVDYTTNNFYNWRDQVYIATRPLAELDAERITFFEEKIRQGERPFAIIMNGSYPEEGFDSADFILDGHHKLKAYQNLNIEPAVAVISRLFRTKQELEFDLESLAEKLYPWQVKHILDNIEGKDQLIAELSARPESSLHKFIRNGDHKEYHYNGKLKRHGFYVNDHAEGRVREWYDNGKPRYESHYTNRIRTGTWKEWYRSGQLRSVYQYNDEGRFHGRCLTYRENGQVQSEYSYRNGEHADGYGYTNWGHTGNKEYECWYKGGILVARKTYNDGGVLIGREKYDAEKEKLVYTPVPRGPAYRRNKYDDFVYSLRVTLIIIMLVWLILSRLL